MPYRAPSHHIAMVPASSVQRALYFLDQLAPRNGAYNVNGLFRVHGRLSLPRLTHALNRLADRHWALRTTLAHARGEVVQRTAPSAAGTAFEFLARTAADPVGEALGEARRGFDLEAGPLWRVTAVRPPGSSAWDILAFTFHHSIMDEQSAALFGRELGLCYADPRTEFGAPACQYPDYIAGLNDGSDLPYWASRLAGLQPLPLPYQQPGEEPSVPFAGHRIELDLSSALQQQILSGSQRHHLSVYMFLLSALAAGMWRLTGRHEFVIAAPISLRPEDADSALGNFSNTMVLCFSLGPDPTVRTLARSARRAVAEALDHKRAPFEQLVAAVRPGRTGSVVPLAQAALFYNREPFGTKWQLGEVRLESLPFAWDVANFDITLNIADAQGSLSSDLTVSQHRLSRTVMTSLAGTYRVMLEQLATAEPDLPLSHLALIGPSARKELLHLAAAPGRWAAPDAPRKPPAGSPGPGATIVELFDAALAAEPAATAVEAADGTVSFAELAAWSDAFTAALGSRQPAGEVVGVCMSRRNALIAAMLGIWRAGSALLLLDSSDPPARLASLLSETGARQVIIDSDAPSQLGNLAGIAVMQALPRPREIGVAAQVRGSGTTGALPSARRAVPTGADTAYVIFTSGSTGTPKAVVIEHASLAAHITQQLSLLCKAPGRLRVGGLSAVTFDTFLNQVAMIVLGHTLVLADEGELRDIPRLVSRNDDPATAITWFDLTPRQIDLLLRAGLMSRRYPPRVLISGGEAVPQRLWDALRLGPARAFNTYGPAECTIDCTLANLRSHSRPTLGRPYGSARVYILDEYLSLVPPGFVGQICIGGAGVARGYLNQPELTAARFVPDPYSCSPGARMYLTGDAGRIDESGNIEFLGRLDEQIKIRGIRVEPGEIETVLSTHPNVSDCAVFSPNGTQLAALIVPSQGACWANDPAVELKRHAAATLPATLVPDQVLLCPDLPLSRNGKVDRKRLAGIYAGVGKQRQVRPMSVAEAHIARLMADVLDVPAIGPDDNFFDHGGDSLRALALMTLVRTQLGLPMELARFMQDPTAAAIAESTKTAQRSTEGASQLSVVELHPSDTPDPRARRHGKGHPVVAASMPTYVLIPPATSSLLCYRSLVDRLGRHARLLGLERLGLGSRAPEALADSAAAVARRLTTQRKGLEPSPLVVAGWSVGGVIAHAVTASLEARSVKVHRLALLDSQLPSAADGVDLRRTADELDQLAACLRHRPRAGHLAAELGYGDTLASLGIAPSALAHYEGAVAADMAETWAAVLRLVAAYDPPRLECRAALLMCNGQGAANDAMAAWGAVCAGLTITPVNVGHFALLTPPEVDNVAAWLDHLAAEQDSHET